MTTFTLPRLDEEPAPTGAGFGALESSVGNLPLKQLGYHSRIMGLATQTTIRQTYYNPFDECIEATFIFPIEGGQAVTDCEMWIGGRVVRARLKERGQARRDYDRAIAQGYRAALLEENRSETFSIKVGNIPPGEAVQIRLQTVGQLPVVRGEWTLRLPLVVAPRYTSGFPLPKTSVGDGVTLDTDQVPDASTVTPPTWLPGFASPVDLQISVDIDLGRLVSSPDWFQQIRSSLHAVSLKVHDASRQSTDGTCRVSVCPGERVNRDFILRGDISDASVATSLVVEPGSQTSSQPTSQAAGSSQTDTEDSLGTFALHIAPPRSDAQIPRDIVFLLDRSGSMCGWKMDTARRGISRLIDTLGDDDRFSVLAFDDRVESPTGGWLNKRASWTQATDANRYKAIQWLAKIESRGGTEMGMALQQGLQSFLKDDSEPASPSSRSRVVVLVTDGQITGEDSVLRLLGTVPQHQRPQIFCLGVDRAVNAGVLQRITAYTGGTFELVESEHRLTQVLDGFAEEIGAPAITGLEIRAGDGSERNLSMVPSRHGVLYSGRCRSIYGRAPYDQSLRLIVRGTLASGVPWEQELIAERKPFSDRPVLLPLWGRARVRELEDRFVADANADESLRNEILQCSLSCNVLCRFTAFVAVDETEKVASQSPPHRIVQPVEHPEGWRHSAVRPLHQSDLIPVPGRAPTINSSAAPLPKKFSDLMLQKGIISPDQLSEAERRSQHSGQDVGEALVMMGYATSDEVGRVLAEAYQLPFVDLRKVEVDEQIVELVPESVARENDILPYLAEGGALTVAMSNPADIETIEKLRFILNRDIRSVVAPREMIREAIDRYYGDVEGESADSMLQEFTDTAIDFCSTSDDMSVERSVFDLSEPSGFDGSIGDDYYLEPPPVPVNRLGIAGRSKFERQPPSPSPSEAPIVRLVQLIMAEAVQLRTSHLILQPGEDAVTVIHVIDGKEVERDRIPLQLLAAVVTRLKILANVDVSICDQPQDGKIEFTVGDRSASCIIHFAVFEEGATVLMDFTGQSTGTHAVPEQDPPEVVRRWWERRKPDNPPSA